MADKSTDSLAEIISSRIKREGPITFEQFMEMALYYPNLGYYASGREKIGPEGDYYTSPGVHPVFGKVLAGQLYEMWSHLEQPRRWQLVEYGAGKGFLARDILNHLRDKHPQSFAALTYYIIETSPYFIYEQQQVLRDAGIPGAKVAWVDNPACVHEGEGVTGVFLSNELVDAFPFHRVRCNAGGQQEIYVDYRSESFLEVEGQLSDPFLARYFVEEGIVLEPGQTAEVNLRSRDWLRELGENLRRGFILTIDYGGSAGEIYSKARFNGTMRCFRRHRLVEDPFESIGDQDITASVNFSSLVRWGEEIGLKAAGHLSQADFLINAGILELAGGRDDFQHDEESYSAANAIKKLILPGGMGSVFRVLVQSKGFPEMPPLKGLTRRFRRP